MMKSLIALTALLSLCGAQTTNYPYSAYLDSDGYFLMKWDVRALQGDIEMQFVVNATGWVSLLIASEDGSYADVIFGGFNEATGYGYYIVILTIYKILNKLIKLSMIYYYSGHA